MPDTAFPLPAPARASMGDELRAAVLDAPERTFLRMQGVELSFRDVDGQSDRLAAALAQRGIRQGDRVSLMLSNCPEFVIIWFALAKLGAVMAPVNTAFRGHVLQQAIDLVESRWLFAHASLAPQWQPLWPDLATVDQLVLVGQAPSLPALPGGTLAFGDLLDEGLDLAVPRPVVSPDDLCLLLYTSGTTGRSKAAMMAHRFVLSQADGFIGGLGLRDDDVLYCPYPLFHLDASVMTITPALRLRCVAAIGERFSVSRYWDEMRAFRATVFDFMGATLTMLWKQPPGPRDRDHHARLGWGVPLPAWAPDFEARFGCRLVELYGSTEVGGILYHPPGQPVRPGSCGRVGSLWEVDLHDADDMPVPVGAVGELVVRPRAPDAITRGYWGMPEATLQAFRNLWFHTGDLLRRDEDGYFYFVGRTKDMVRRRGENISAAEVEMGLETHPDVLECAVYGVPSEWTEEEVMASVVVRPGSSLTPRALAEHASRTMTRFMVPRHIRFVDALPKTPTDKVEKFRLIEQGVTADTWDRERDQPLTP
ncbi:MAG: AMP-binding protein [Hydrogenophaga sp.]|nr:AMP-binding protein [Hydrogenophaga sp.]HAJ13451.1 ATP-dependent acyl-CoA ligase [Comamonadaceae bacterium]